MNTAQKIENMRVMHEFRAFKNWERKYADDDWLEEECDRILGCALDLGQACLDADPDMTISEAVALEAQRRLRDLQEGGE
jgi:hypothetical protein